MDYAHIPWLLAAAILLPLAGAVLPALAARRLGRHVGRVTLVFPLLSTVLLLMVARLAGPEPRIVVEWPWVPSLGVELAFLVDGLSLFFGLIVSGVGVLIVFYAIHYLGRDVPHQGRFYSYLILFMAAMLGTVFADHVILLFAFWELTGLASFLLIGFLHEQKSSRVGARQALLVTASTGLIMLAGLVLLANHAGTYRISELMARGQAGWADVARLGPALLLILVGAFGKSAQFPFFFWLPNAMAAPTPVSAYLHSATMVKLGVFLCARLTPVFSDHPWWTTLLTSVCFGTMLLGGLIALFQRDLKAMLAFSTVAQLGFLCGWYGYGNAAGLRFDYLHILNHTLYKGGLFMVAGLVDHAAHTRDIRRLGGLFRHMPLVGMAALLCAASMAGVPGTSGFIGKETALADLLAGWRAGLPGAGWMLAAFTLSALLAIVLATRFFTLVFLGEPQSDGARHAHEPTPAATLPPLFLAAAVMGFGLAPGALEAIGIVWRVPGLQLAEPGHLHLWHGFTPELAVSLSLLAAGIPLALGLERARVFDATLPRALDFGEHFERALRILPRMARSVSRGLQTDRPVVFLPIVLLTGLGFIGWQAWAGGLLTSRLAELWHAREPGTAEPLRVFVAALIGTAVVGVLVLKRWTTQLIALSAAGFLTTFFFVIYRAPDLALTQILVEAISLILVLLLLGRFPRSAERGETSTPASHPRRLLNVLVAAATGLLMTVLVVVLTAHPPPDPLGPFFLRETMRLAQGSNAVNTVLIDFRGFDTLGEITVLLVATLGCLGLFMRYKRTPEEFQAGAAGPAGFAEAEKEDR